MRPNFVQHQVHVVAVAQLARAPQVVGVVDGHAGRALDQGLDDEGGRVFVVFFEPAGQGGGSALGHVGGRFARPRAARIRARHGGTQAHQRRVGFAEQRDVGDGKCAHGLAVVAAGHADETVLARAPGVAPVVRAHLERDLGGTRAVAAVEGMAQAGECGQALRQLHHRRVREAGEHDVVEAVELVLERGADGRVVVAEEVDPPGGDRVEITPAFVVVEPDAFCL